MLAKEYYFNVFLKHIYHLNIQNRHLMLNFLIHLTNTIERFCINSDFKNMRISIYILINKRIARINSETPALE